MMNNIINLPGNIVRGTGNVVSGTVSAVASVAGVRKNVRDGEIIIQDKTTVTIKDTPPKDAITSTNLAIKNGYLMKRNEQGTWLKRYCCIVPHMFLYYFDNETAENPVGIIDLQYYTSADIQAGNILKLSTSESVKARSFFFQIDDPSILSEWIGCIHRERYGVIRDERDAYQQLQDHFSSQMEFSMKMMEENSTEKEKMLQETNNLQRTIESSLMCIKSSLEILGVSANSNDLLSSCNTLKDTVVSMKQNYHMETEEKYSERVTEKNSLEDRIESLEKQLSEEMAARRILEARVAQQRHECDHRVKDAMQEVEKSKHNYELVWTMNVTLEEKITALTDQKRTLVKEVKTQRKKLDIKTDVIQTLYDANMKLLKATTAYRDEICKGLACGGALSVVDETSGEKQSVNEEDLLSGVVLNGVVQYVTSLHEAKDTWELSTTVVSTGDDDSNQLSAPSKTVLWKHDEPPSPAHVSASQQVQGQGNVPWEGDRSSLLRMDWLVPEQRILLEKQQQQLLLQQQMNIQSSQHGESESQHGSSSLYASTPLATANNSKRSSITEITDSISSLFGKATSQEIEFTSESQSSHAGDEGTATASNRPFPGRINAPSESTATRSSSVVIPKTPSVAEGSTNRPSSTVMEGPNPHAPRCYRCHGTVEGPKYSTCKCEIPAMTEEEASSSSLFKGFLEKGKKSAGGFAGSFKISSPLGGLFHSSSADEEKSGKVQGSQSGEGGGGSWKDSFGAVKSPTISAKSIMSGNSPLLNLDESDALTRSTSDPEKVEVLGQWGAKSSPAKSSNI